LPILAAPLRFVVSYAVNPYRPANIRTNLSCSETTVRWLHFLSLALKAHVHSVMHCQLWKHNIRTSSVPSAKRTLRRIGHSRLFKVILLVSKEIQNGLFS